MKVFPLEPTMAQSITPITAGTTIPITDEIFALFITPLSPVISSER